MPDEVLAFCREKNIAMMAYSPLALGLLTGKIGPERTFTGDDLRIDNPRFSVENRQRVAVLVDQFQPVASKYNLSVGQLVIAWTAAQPGITHVLVGARNAQQALENARGGAVHLSAEDVQALNDLLAQHGPEIV